MVRVEIGVLNRRYLACQISAIKFAKCACSRDFFYAHRCELPLKSISQVERVYHRNNAAIGEKNRPVCPHQSVAKITCDFRWRSNSLRSSYKMPGVSPA